MKVSNPYGCSDTYKSGSAIVDDQNRRAAGKAKMRFPDKPLGTSTKSGEAGKMKVAALTPGSSPSGS